MFDQGLFRALLVLLGQTHSVGVTKEQSLHCIWMAGQERLRCEEEVLWIVVGQLFLRIDQVVTALGGPKFLGRRKDADVELSRLHGREPGRGRARLDDLHILGSIPFTVSAYRVMKSLEVPY